MDSGKLDFSKYNAVFARKRRLFFSSSQIFSGKPPIADLAISSLLSGSVFPLRLPNGSLTTSHKPFVCNLQNGYSEWTLLRGGPNWTNKRRRGSSISVKAARRSCPLTIRPSASRMSRGLCGARWSPRCHTFRFCTDSVTIFCVGFTRRVSTLLKSLVLRQDNTTTYSCRATQ